MDATRRYYIGTEEFQEGWEAGYKDGLDCVKCRYQGYESQFAEGYVDGYSYAMNTGGRP